jgi:hypothetical protein
MAIQPISDSKVKIMANGAVSNLVKRRIIQLIYRGEIFDYTLPEIEIDHTDRSTWQVVELVYRGHAYDLKLPPQQPYQKPRALNWRWQ